MKRNERGVTLIALVVTIVVLLILAGTAIAMLSGDDGIMTNAQRSQAANTEGEVREKIKMAYNAVKTEISVNSAVESDYNAQADTANLYAIAVAEMGLPSNGVSNTTQDGYIVKLAASGEDVSGNPVPTIYFEYRDNKFGGVTAASNLNTTTNKITNGTSKGNQRIDGDYLRHIWGYITIVTDNASLTLDAAQVLK